MSLRRRPVSLGNGRPAEDRAALFELVCCWCGHDPAEGYRQVSAELQRVRRPCPLAEGVEAFIRHEEVHDRAEPSSGQSRQADPGTSPDLP